MCDARCRASSRQACSARRLQPGRVARAGCRCLARPLRRYSVRREWQQIQPPLLRLSRSGPCARRCPHSGLRRHCAAGFRHISSSYSSTAEEQHSAVSYHARLQQAAEPCGGVGCNTAHCADHSQQAVELLVHWQKGLAATQRQASAVHCKSVALGQLHRTSLTWRCEELQ